MRLKKYEIRISVTKSLYDLISQEAKNHDSKIAAVARDKLAEHPILREKLVHHAEISNTSQVNQDGNILHSKLMKTEKQISLAVSKIESLLALNHDQMNFIITMIDQLYIELMKYLPEIPQQLTLAAESIAKARHRQWLELIKKVIDNEK